MDPNLVAEVHERLRILQDAADDLANTRTIDAEARAEASGVAHRLARSLEDGGFASAAHHVRVVIGTLDHPGLPQPERLQEQVAALAKLLFSDTLPDRARKP